MVISLLSSYFFDDHLCQDKERLIIKLQVKGIAFFDVECGYLQ
jgi:hypothetical protein